MDDADGVVGKALPGETPESDHSHKVVLTGKFKREEKREPEHKRGKRPEERKERERS